MMKARKSILLILFIFCGLYSYADVVLTPAEECCHDIVFQLNEQNKILINQGNIIQENNLKIDLINSQLETIPEKISPKQTSFIECPFIFAGIVMFIVICIAITMIPFKYKKMDKEKKKAIDNFFRKHCILFISILISAMLVIILGIVRCIIPCYCLLDIDTKWLIVAGIPILLGLILGGYIKSFKGFGIELGLNTQVPNSWIEDSGITIEYASTTNKGNINDLNRLDSYSKGKIKGLRMIINKQDYYKEYALNKYLMDLPNLAYIEITSEAHEFICLIPVKNYPLIMNSNDENLFSFFSNELIEAIESGNITRHFPVVIDSYILETENKIDIYNKLSYNPQSKYLYPMAEVLPVLDRSRKMIGLINKLTITDKITQAVIYNSLNKK